MAFILWTCPIILEGIPFLNKDGSYTIIINAHLSAEMQLMIYEHELAHINSSDFEITNESVDALELRQHIT